MISIVTNVTYLMSVMEWFVSDVMLCEAVWEGKNMNKQTYIVDMSSMSSFHVPCGSLLCTQQMARMYLVSYTRGQLHVPAPHMHSKFKVGIFYI